MAQLKTAVIYARFSCSKQREASIDDQLRVCREWAASHGYEVVAEYCDYAQSGRSDDRPQFQRMIMNAGESEIVLVYMMDRFSRSEFDAPIYKRELRKHGVELVSAMETLPDGPERILVEKIYEGLAAVESAKTSIRVRRGMEGNALQCRSNGINVFGYSRDKDDRYVINEQEALFVREAFQRRANRESCTSIARDFARRGVKTTRGRECCQMMIARIIKCRRYIGEYRWGEIVVPDGMPKIIDEELFMAANRAPSKKCRKNEHYTNYALSGKLICSSCGHNMVGVSGRGRSNIKYVYYDCRRCSDVKPVRAEQLEGDIVAAIRDVLRDRETALRVSHAIWDETPKEIAIELSAAEKSKREAETGLANLVSALEKGFAGPEIQTRMEQLRLQKLRAEHQIERLQNARVDPEDFASFLQYSGGLDDKTLLDAFVYQAILAPDKVIVTMNYNRKNGEPAQIEIERVLRNDIWCAVRDSNPGPWDYESVLKMKME